MGDATAFLLVMNRASVEMFAPVKEVFEQAQRLRDIGLNVPQITRIFLDLKRDGYNVDTSVFTPEQACRQILAIRDGRTSE